MLDLVVARREVDGGPPVAPAIRGYFGSSRGRWEGDTLVVEIGDDELTGCAAPASMLTTQPAP